MRYTYPHHWQPPVPLNGRDCDRGKVGPGGSPYGFFISGLPTPSNLAFRASRFALARAGWTR